MATPTSSRAPRHLLVPPVGVPYYSVYSDRIFCDEKRPTIHLHGTLRDIFGDKRHTVSNVLALVSITGALQVLVSGKLLLASPKQPFSLAGPAGSMVLLFCLTTHSEWWHSALKVCLTDIVLYFRFLCPLAEFTCMGSFRKSMTGPYIACSFQTLHFSITFWISYKFDTGFYWQNSLSPAHTHRNTCNVCV
jgi:hypothetical protein